MRTRFQVLSVTFLLLVAAAPSLLAQADGVRDVTASDRSLISLNTKVRYTTMILLPEGEDIVDVVCGDRDFWVISASENIAHVKPAKEGAATNLNLVTTSGTVYSFLLSEGKAPQPDLKVYITPDSSVARTTKYYSAAQVTALQTELTQAHAAIDSMQHQSQEVVATVRRQYPETLQFDYATPKYAKPFYVRSIWHDDAFTYIKSDARELPALYEMRDGQPAVVNFQVQNGTYVVPKVIERGYLTLGKDRLTFEQRR